MKIFWDDWLVGEKEFGSIFIADGYRSGDLSSRSHSNCRAQLY
jgi:hypothetical protein